MYDAIIVGARCVGAPVGTLLSRKGVTPFRPTLYGKQTWRGRSAGGSPPPLDGIDYAVAPRRTLLDKLLIDAAVGAGAELREAFYCSEILTEDGRVYRHSGTHAGRQHCRGEGSHRGGC
jgi:hypothetical protein